MPDFYTIYTDSAGQIITGQIKKNGKPYNIDSAKFLMRNAAGDTIVVNQNATVIASATGNVEYTWQSGDIDTPGEYYYWWRGVKGSEVIETPEQLAIVDEHAPGIRTRTGAIYRAAKSILPSTWDALEKRYGDALLQDHINASKLNVFGTEVSVADESTYDIRVILYIAKIVALCIIPAGIDYWLDQKIAIATSGSNENSSYPDRIAALKELREQLIGEVSAERGVIESILGVGQVLPSGQVPQFSEGKEDGFITPLPATNFPDYGFDTSRDSRHRRGSRRNARWIW